MKVVGNSRKPSQLSDVALADREWERQCGDLARLASDWLWEMDSDFRIIYLSDRVRWILGVDPAFFIEKQREDYVASSTDSAKLKAHLADLRVHRPIREFIYDVETPSGRRYVKSTAIRCLTRKGIFRATAGSGRRSRRRFRPNERPAQAISNLSMQSKASPLVLPNMIATTGCCFGTAPICVFIPG